MFEQLTFLAMLVGAAPNLTLDWGESERVVWIGNALVEREQRYGYWESALLAALPGKRLVVRNLGWSGDTVFGEARAGFDTPAKGFERLVSLTLELKPTIIFISYGNNESFEGPAGLERFQQGLGHLLDALKPSNARLVLFTPLPFSTRLVQQNKNLSLYSQAICQIAKDRQLVLADLVAQFPEGLPHNLTENGMHLTAEGYRQTRSAFIKSLGLNCSITDEQLNALASAVVAKNELFFHKWRPQNETYLFGFRKREQGQHVKELAQFDPLIDAAEQRILAELHKLTSRPNKQ